MKRLGSFFDEIYGFDGMSSFLLFISVILNLVTFLPRLFSPLYSEFQVHIH